jgi:SNF2 family DNA or RNA helicase
MENHLGELWSLMSFVNPGYLGDKTGFARRWRNPIEKHADSERSNILARRVKPFMLRRTKQEVASELPPKTEITESVVLDTEQRAVYDSIRLSMHKKVRQAIAAKGFAKSHIIILEALLKLRQVCCDPRLLKLSNSEVKAPVPSAKLERLMEMLDSLLPEGRKIIVFSQFTSMLSLIMQRLESAGISFSLLTGETTDRKTAIENFQSGQVNVFLVSLKAGGVGLNLTAADTVILYDPWWNPAVEEQAIDRAYRIGQDKPVFVYRLVASQTIEEKMDELKAKKRAIAESIFNQAANPAAALTEDDLSSLFDEY